MALFDKFKSGGSEGDSGPGRRFDPAKAEKFFTHARTAFETARYEYAVQLWLQGLKQDPDSMDALLGFFAAATAYVNENPKGVAKEARKALSGSTDLDKLSLAILDCGIKQLDAGLRVKAAEQAGKLGLSQVTKYLAEAAMRLAVAEKKPRKDYFIKLRAAFERAGAYTEAVIAAQKAVEFDPSDRVLADELRNMMAQAAMSQGGFDKTGEEGGFRKNIRNADKQRELEDADRLSKTDDTKKRVLKSTFEEYQLRPKDVPTIMNLVKSLEDMGSSKYDLEAMKLCNKAFKETEQYSFRERAGDIQMRLARAQIRDLTERVQNDPENEDLREKLASSKASLAETEIRELTMRVEHYPTDLPRKFSLAEKLAQAGRYEEAIPLLQLAKDDSRNRLRAMKLLAECFLETDFAEGAEQTYRDAMGRVEDEGSDIALDLRYGLMRALQLKGEQEKDIDALSEASDLASAIAIQKFTFRDIRERRDQIKQLLADLKG